QLRAPAVRATARPAEAPLRGRELRRSRRIGRAGTHGDGRGIAEGSVPRAAEGRRVGRQLFALRVLVGGVAAAGSEGGLPPEAVYAARVQPVAAQSRLRTARRPVPG